MIMKSKCETLRLLCVSDVVVKILIQIEAPCVMLIKIRVKLKQLWEVTFNVDLNIFHFKEMED